MNKISVIGAGTMGLDIAQVFAQHGYELVVRDMTDEIIKKSAERLESAVARQVERGKITEDEAKTLLSRVTFTTTLDDCADSDIIVEAIIEDINIKKELFATLDSICKPETILVTNTSSISITALASAVKRKDKFVGMHFFNPVMVMKLVEVIRGIATSKETLERIMELSVKIGKEPVEVNDAPGFIVNKILIPMINEAVCVLADGVASAEDIDMAMKLGANHPMGPLALADLIGNDVVLHIMNILHEETGDPKYKPSLLLKRMVRGNLLGRKTGKGFYEYD